MKQQALNQQQAMKKPCSQYATGSEPRCTHEECWFVYFTMHPAMPRMVKDCITRFGGETAVRRFGKRYMKMTLRFLERSYGRHHQNTE